MKLIGFYLFFSLMCFISSISAQEMDFFEPKTTISGYGELHYNAVTPPAGNTTKTLDFHRFVLFFGHSWSEKWSFKSEVELEHNFVRGGQGELELEQAYINYHHADYLGFQVGVILPSVGLLNEYHEPPLFLSVERPDYASSIIPTTWFGNGAAVYGTYKGFDYKVTVMEALDADQFSASSGIRGGRKKGYLSDARHMLYNVRFDYLGVPGLRAGASYTYNNAISDSANTIGNNEIGLIEVHAKYEANNIYAVFEYGNISFGSGNIESAMGYYADLGYNFGNLLNIETAIIPFIRYSDINNVSSSISGGNIEQQYHFTQIMFGLSIKPLPQVVFKMDYSERTRELGDVKTKYFNIGAGYMF
ncbi:MAG: hypothetical protein R6W90_00150 [Ignavibacteriaceae bacterium]